MTLLTILRVCLCAENDSVEKLSRVGEKLNTRAPGSYKRLAGKDQRHFSVNVCDSQYWGDHLEAAVSCLTNFRDIITEAFDDGVEMQLDTAIWKEDRKRAVVTQWPLSLELVDLLSETHVSPMFSLY
jgi:hypothetical protein